MFDFDSKMNRERAINLSPIVLAFVGDAVHSLYVREKLVFNSDKKSGALNKLATEQVKASAQAGFVKGIIPLLREEELSVFKRARNTKKTTRAKNASVADYNAATGFEAVLGFLYLTGDRERITFLLEQGRTEKDED